MSTSDDGLSGADSISIWNPMINIPSFQKQLETKDSIVPLFLTRKINLESRPAFGQRYVLAATAYTFERLL